MNLTETYDLSLRSTDDTGFGDDIVTRTITVNSHDFYMVRGTVRISMVEMFFIGREE